MIRYRAFAPVGAYMKNVPPFLPSFCPCRGSYGKRPAISTELLPLPGHIWKTCLYLYRAFAPVGAVMKFQKGLQARPMPT